MKSKSDEETSVVYVDDDEDVVEDEETESARSRAKPVSASMMPSKSPSDAPEGRRSDGDGRAPPRRSRHWRREAWRRGRSRAAPRLASRKAHTINNTPDHCPKMAGKRSLVSSFDSSVHSRDILPARGESKTI